MSWEYLKQNVGVWTAEEQQSVLLEQERLKAMNYKLRDFNAGKGLLARMERMERAIRKAVMWVHDPDENPLERFERIADEFQRETGFLRPGKSEPMESPSDQETRNKTWDAWVAARSRFVIGELRAALSQSGGEG